MSVIFKTLKKLRAQSRESVEGASKSKKRRNVLSLSGILASPKTVFFLIGVIFLSGIAVYYGADLVKKRIHSVSPAKNARVTGAAKIRETPAPQTSTERDGAAAPEEIALSVPPPPDAIPVEERSSSGQERRDIPMQPPRPETMVTARYHPPRRDARQAVPGSDYRTDKNGSDLTEAAVTFPAAGRHGVADRNSDRPVEESGTVMKDTEQAGDQGPASPPDVPAVVKKTQKIDIYRIKSQKNTKIARIVTDIERSIAAGRSDTHISTLLNRLAVLKGKEDAYVLKMQAFSKIRQGDLRSAQSILEHVLKTHEDDLEAGINMAIIEIKSGRHGDAKERLLSLLDLHPNNTLIADMLLQLK